MAVIQGSEVLKILKLLGINTERIRSAYMQFRLDDVVIATIEYDVRIDDKGKFETKSKQYKLIEFENHSIDK